MQRFLVLIHCTGMAGINEGSNEGAKRTSSQAHLKNYYDARHPLLSSFESESEERALKTVSQDSTCSDSYQNAV